MNITQTTDTMASTVSKLLCDNWDNFYREFPRDAEFLAGVSWYKKNYYFFLKSELLVKPAEWDAAKREGKIRHCIPYVTKDGESVFLDYVVHKKFKTIEEWATDAGGDIMDILYGENRIHRGIVSWNYETNSYDRIPFTPKYIELWQLLEMLNVED